MSKKFITTDDRTPEVLDWGNLIWLSNSKVTNAKQLVVIEVNLEPGKGHNFHYHPGQEEVIYVIQGQIEQWVERETKTLRAGESAFIPADVVHASFNTGNATAKLLAIIGPCKGEMGYELVDVFEQAPWKTLRD